MFLQPTFKASLLFCITSVKDWSFQLFYVNSGCDIKGGLGYLAECPSLNAMLGTHASPVVPGGCMVTVADPYLYCVPGN